jgi:plastocyanin
MKASLFGRRGVAALGLAACLLLMPGASTLAQGSTTINMNPDTFARTEVHIAPGQTVVWNDPNNPDSQTHTVTADDGSFDSGDVNPGDQYTMEFDTPGSYPFYCQYHGGPGGEGMSGVIVVGS